MASSRIYFHLLLAVIVATIASVITVPRGALAADADPLQDFCVADLQSKTIVNGFPCKSADKVTAEDFAFAGLAQAANTGNPFKAGATLAFVQQWPALNTLGLSLVRSDFLPGGVIPPHTHHLATEILICLEGEIYTGFVTNSDNPAKPNKLYAKVVKAGEAFIFPRGLLHFQLNNGTKPARSLNVLNGQNPGIQLMPIALFGTGIDPEVLAKSFFISETEVGELASVLSQFANLKLN